MVGPVIAPGAPPTSRCSAVQRRLAGAEVENAAISAQSLEKGIAESARQQRRHRVAWLPLTRAHRSAPP